MTRTPSDAPLRILPSPTDITAMVISSIALVQDEFAQTAALDYWDMSAAEHHEVVARLKAAARAEGAGELLGAVDAALNGPLQPGPARRLAELAEPGIALGCDTRSADGPPERQQAWRALALQAVRADAASRLSMHLGESPAQVAPVAAADVPAPGPVAPGAGRPTVTVVIPFRDRSADRSRLRNLLACLSALGDQSLPREEYRIVAVEADVEPRHAELIRQRADHYLHLPCDGHFNKSWAVNAGVVQAGGDAEIICVHDADILVGHDFLERNVTRFRSPGHQAHWPFRDPLCMDPASTDLAITRRCVEGARDIPLGLIGGVRLRQPPGHCIWVRSGTFHRVGGLDERFEGWGGEDLDFAFRLNVVVPVDRFDDVLLHMFHPRPQITQNGQRFYAGRTLLTWSPSGPIGQLSGPAGSVDDDLAGIMQLPVGGA
ncbi:glycosyltransferase [Streptomyces sp. DT224]|uniref:glycosyltransferase n=1 Tax=Streptomyces sp. DT224 TaxID=3393426 RepID=UPI003CFB6B39